MSDRLSVRKDERSHNFINKQFTDKELQIKDSRVCLRNVVDDSLLIERSKNLVYQLTNRFFVCKNSNQLTNFQIDTLYYCMERSQSKFNESAA
jgi:hypothetical protein